MKELESGSGDQKPGSEAKENQLEARDEYLEETHPPENIIGKTYLRKWRPTVQLAPKISFQADLFWSSCYRNVWRGQWSIWTEVMWRLTGNWGRKPGIWQRIPGLHPKKGLVQLLEPWTERRPPGPSGLWMKDPEHSKDMGASELNLHS